MRAQTAMRSLCESHRLRSLGLKIVASFSPGAADPQKSGEEIQARLVKTEVNDPHVSALLYRLMHVASVNYDKAEPLEYETVDFKVTINNRCRNFLGVSIGLAMEPPTNMHRESLHDEQVKVFRMIPPLDPAHLERGQFRGYRNEPGVASNSKVETFAALRPEVDSWRWAGVPFLIRTGKRLPVTATEVLVKLRRPPVGKGTPGANYLRFRLGPDLALNPGARIKRPGPGLDSMPTELSAVNRARSGELEPYERLLTDAMHGDALLFVREDAVEAAWSIVEPILGNVTPVHSYKPGAWGPAQADRLAADIGGWHDPQKHPEV